MPRFMSDEELRLLAGDASAVAERADDDICELRRQVHTVCAEADAAATAAIAAKQACALHEQRFATLSADFYRSQAEAAELAAASQRHAAELGSSKAKIAKDAGDIQQLKVEIADLHTWKSLSLELIEHRGAEIKEKDATVQSYRNEIIKLADGAASIEARLDAVEAQITHCQANHSTQENNGSDGTAQTDIWGLLRLLMFWKKTNHYKKIPEFKTESTVAKGDQINWMAVFRSLLSAFVIIILPITLFFFPWKEEAVSQNALLSVTNKEKWSIEKSLVIGFFVFHGTVGVLGVLLAHIAHGGRCRRIVGSCALWTVVSVVVFVDYVLYRSLPYNTTYIVLFVLHLLGMIWAILCLSAFFVGPLCCCGPQDDETSSVSPTPRPPV